MARYDWDSDKITILSSSRRRPAQNQFDDRAALQVKGMFLGPNNRLCVTTSLGTYYLQETPGDWKEVFEGTTGDDLVSSGDKSIVFNSKMEVTCFDPTKSQPQYWMASPDSFVRKMKGQKVPTPWSQQSLFDPPPSHPFMGLINTGVHDQNLFVLEHNDLSKEKPFDLLWYDAAKGRTPQRIPLEFHLKAVDRDVLALQNEPGSNPLGVGGFSVDDIEHPDHLWYPCSLKSTPQGIYIELERAGFWFIPYSDIDAYLKSVKK